MRGVLILLLFIVACAALLCTAWFMAAYLMAAGALADILVAVVVYFVALGGCVYLAKCP